MTTKPAVPTRKCPSKARGLIKVASLGLVGFIAGLLTDARPTRR